MFYNYFAELCKIKGVSMSKACREIGISKTAPMKWKKGYKPQSDNMEKIAEYFDIPLKELMNEGKKEETTDIGDLTKDDIELVKWWRSLSEENRQAIRVLSGKK